MSQEIKDKNGLTEAEYLASYDPKAFPQPSATADICVIAKEGGSSQILLIRRGNHPCLGQWALPGGFANENEPLEETAARELLEETGISGVSLELIGVYSKPGRDPRGWTITAAYAALVEKSAITVQAGDDAAAAAWFTLTKKGGVIMLKKDDLILPVSADAPEGTGWLAFDHTEIIGDAVKKFL